jgi:nucleotide-binding universal stress UspA family protein
VAKDGGYDLLVMGHRGRSSVWGTFMGTMAEKVARHVTCSVLVIR